MPLLPQKKLRVATTCTSGTSALARSLGSSLSTPRTFLISSTTASSMRTACLTEAEALAGTEAHVRVPRIAATPTPHPALDRVRASATTRATTCVGALSMTWTARKKWRTSVSSNTIRNLLVGLLFVLLIFGWWCAMTYGIYLMMKAS